MENLQPEDIKLIRLYVLQLANEEEKQMIEEKMRSNPDFADEVEIQRIAQMLEFTKIKDHLKELRDEMVANGDLNDEKENRPLKELPLLKSDEKSLGQPETKVISLWYKRLAAAAVIIGLLGAGIWFLFKSPATEDQVADDSRKEQPAQPGPAIDPSTDDMVNGLISEARQPREEVPGGLKGAVGAFEKENTDQAIKLLLDPKISESKTGPKNEYGASQDGVEGKNDPVLESYRKFYLGVSYLTKGDAARALVYLREVKAPLEEDGRWYTALAYLKNNEPAKARPILVQFRDRSASRYASEAGLLLDGLK